MLGHSNNYNFIKFTNKTTPSKDFDRVHKFLFDIIGDNMTSLVHTGKYNDINEVYPTNMGNYMVKYVSYAFTLQKYITTDR